MAISFGVVSWETLSKTYFVADPSQNSNDDITKGDFFWRSELGWETLSKTYSVIAYHSRVQMKISRKVISFGVGAHETCNTQNEKPRFESVWES